MLTIRAWWCWLRRHPRKTFTRLDGEVVRFCERCVLEYRG